jgi:hypothetical protein
MSKSIRDAQLSGACRATRNGFESPEAWLLAFSPGKGDLKSHPPTFTSGRCSARRTWRETPSALNGAFLLSPVGLPWTRERRLT